MSSHKIIQKPPSLSEHTLTDDTLMHPGTSYKYMEETIEQSEEQHVVESEQVGPETKSTKNNWMKRSRKASIKLMQKLSNSIQKPNAPVDAPGVTKLSEQLLVSDRTVQALPPPKEKLLITDDVSNAVHESASPVDSAINSAKDISAETPFSPDVEQSESEYSLKSNNSTVNVCPEIDRSLVTKASRLSLASRVTFAESQLNPHKFSSAFQDLIKQWEDDMDLSLQQIQEYKRALHRKREKVGTLEQQLQDMQQHIEQQNEHRVMVEQHHAETKDVVESLENKLDQQALDYKLLEQEKANLESEIKRLKSDLEYQESIDKDLISRLSASNAKATSLEDELEAASKHTVDLSDKIESKEAQFVALLESKIALEDDLIAVKQESRSKDEQIADLIAETERLKFQLHNHESNVNSAMHSLKLDKEIADRKQSEVTKLFLVQEREKRELMAQIQQLKSQMHVDTCDEMVQTLPVPSASSSAQTAHVSVSTVSSQTQGEVSAFGNEYNAADASIEALDRDFERLDRALYAAKERSFSAKKTADNLAKEASSMHSNIHSLDSQLGSSDESFQNTLNESNFETVQKERHITIKRDKQKHHMAPSEPAEPDSVVAESVHQVQTSLPGDNSVFNDEDVLRLENALDELVARNLLIDKLRAKLVKYKEANLRGAAHIERLKRKILELEVARGSLQSANEKLVHMTKVSERTVQRGERRSQSSAHDDSDSLSSIVVRRETKGGCCSSVTRVFKKRTTVSTPNERYATPAGSKLAGSTESAVSSQTTSILRGTEVPVPVPVPVCAAVTGSSPIPVGADSQFNKKVSFHTDYQTIAPPFQPTLTTFPLPYDPTTNTPLGSVAASPVPVPGTIISEGTDEQNRQALLKKQEQQRHREMIA